MTIKLGDTIPSATLMQMKDGGPKPVSTDDLFKGKKVALFALPGAFTPSTTFELHRPGACRGRRCKTRASRPALPTARA